MAYFEHDCREVLNYIRRISSILAGSETCVKGLLFDILFTIVKLGIEFLGQSNKCFLYLKSSIFSAAVADTHHDESRTKSFCHFLKIGAIRNPMCAFALWVIILTIFQKEFGCSKRLHRFCPNGAVHVGLQHSHLRRIQYRMII